MALSGLLLGDAVGRITGSGRFLRELWRDYAGQIRAIRLSRMMQLAVRYRDYPLVSMWGALINASGLALPSLFLLNIMERNIRDGLPWSIAFSVFRRR